MEDVEEYKLMGIYYHSTAYRNNLPIFFYATLSNLSTVKLPPYVCLCEERKSR